MKYYKLFIRDEGKRLDINNMNISIQTDRQRDEYIDRQIDEYIDRQIDEQINRQVNRQINRQIFRYLRQLDRQIER